MWVRFGFRSELLLALAALISAVGVPLEARAVTLYDNGSGGEAIWCNSGSLSCGDFHIFDDFTLGDALSTVEGFTFDSSLSNGTVGYDFTNWAIWDVNPFTNFGDGPLISGTAVGILEDIGDPVFRITVSGLSINLTAGTYWLQTQNEFGFDNNSSSYVTSLTGGGLLALQSSGNSAPFSNTRPESAFTIQGTVIPEPTSVALLGLGLVGLAALRRKRA